jgi:hypothetical protein
VNTASKHICLLCVLSLAGCAGKNILPPEIVKVPVYIPLPADCGVMQPVVLPVGSTPTDVMAQLKAAVDAYNDQVSRCFAIAIP